MIKLIHYPTRNVIGVNPVWMPRRIKILQRIDLMESPLPIADYLRRPLVRRGRWLLRAYDCDSKRFRSFYECAIQSSFRELPLRIGRRTDDGRIKAIGRSFAPTVEDRRLLAMALHRVKFHPVFVYADGLAIIRESS